MPSFILRTGRLSRPMLCMESVACGRAAVLDEIKINIGIIIRGHAPQRPEPRSLASVCTEQEQVAGALSSHSHPPPPLLDIAAAARRSL